MGAAEPSEGVIKYRLRWRRRRLPAAVGVRCIERWREPLWRLRLVGQHPGRYGGLGYGNLSCRLSRFSRRFLVTGTQTGGRAHLKSADYAIVLRADPLAGFCWATGLTRPSSEALTHGILYQSGPRVGAVIHVHSPDIWQRRDELDLPSTPVTIPYGSTGMADAVMALARDIGPAGLIVMGGHEDGVLAWGRNFEEASLILLRAWSRARQRSSGVRSGAAGDETTPV